MEFVTLDKKAVEIYTFDPAHGYSEPTYSFPPVQTKDGAEWSSDGNFLGLVEPKTGGVVVYNASAEYAVCCKVPPLVGGPIRKFYFSPLGHHLVTHENYVKDGGANGAANVGVWETKTGELKFSFILKHFTDLAWPPLKWTNMETHCCRMVQDGVQIMSGAMEKGEEGSKITAPGIMAFEVAPRGAGTSVPYVAICIAETKGSPAKCQTYRLDAPETPTAGKSFYKAQSVKMMWNGTGSALLVRASVDVDDTGKNYYGGTNLYFMRPDGQEDCIVAAAGEGAVHDVQWSPTQDEFVLLHGDLPCSVGMLDGKKARKLFEMGTGHRNTIRFNQFGRFVAVGGYGQLLGDTDFWDRPSKKKLGSVRLECCVLSAWGPDGRHFMAATTAPRMRVDNKVVMYDYVGNLLGSIPFEELLAASWRPRSRGMYAAEDRPASPGRENAGGKGAGGKGGYGGAAAAKPKAYVPPGQRSGRGGGLSELLRGELGSTSANTTGTASKAFGGVPGMRLPPGAAPEDLKDGGGGGVSRNARKKAGKEKAKEAGQDTEAAPAPAKAAAPAPAKAAAPAPATVSAESDPAEVEKKVRALRKKLRDIDKLKEKPEKDLDTLQKQKLAGEAELIQQIRDLGAEP